MANILRVENMRANLTSVLGVLYPIAAFKAIKALMAKDWLLSYPDPNIVPYNIKTDASDYQMGAAVIKQNGWPVAFFAEIAQCATQLYYN
jgi:hypothetical protein